MCFYFLYWQYRCSNEVKQRWKGVMLSSVYDDDGNFSMLEGSENLISAKNMSGITSTEDAFAGIFEDKEGREGYLVVNFTDPAKKRKNKVTLALTNATRAIVVKEGKEEVKKVDGGKLELDLDEGDGVFVIPY